MDQPHLSGDSIGAVFTLPHLLNPEASAGGWLTMFFGYFLCTGVVWAVVSLIDRTTELAIGAHFANNIGFFLVVNAVGGTANTPALFTVSVWHVTFQTLSVLVIVPLFLMIFYGVFKRGRQFDFRSQGKDRTDDLVES